MAKPPSSVSVRGGVVLREEDTVRVIHVLVADDQQLRVILEAEPDIEVVHGGFGTRRSV